MGRCSIEPKKGGKYHQKFVDCLDDICLKLLHVLGMQLVRAYIFKKVTDFHECIPYLI